VSVALAIVLCGSSCTDESGESSAPDACVPDHGDQTSTTVSKRCGAALFDQALDDVPGALAGLDRNEIKRDVAKSCASVEQTTTASGARPLRVTVVDDLSSELGLKPRATEAILRLAAYSCPATVERLGGLPRLPAPATVTLTVDGDGPLVVKRTVAGESSEIDVQSHWADTVVMADPSMVELDSSARNRRKLSCSVAVNGVVVTRSDVTARSVLCRVSAGEIEQAAASAAAVSGN
jgi:hypothetical protein